MANTSETHEGPAETRDNSQDERQEYGERSNWGENNDGDLSPLLGRRVAAPAALSVTPATSPPSLHINVEEDFDVSPEIIRRRLLSGFHNTNHEELEEMEIEAESDSVSETAVEEMPAQPLPNEAPQLQASNAPPSNSLHPATPNEVHISHASSSPPSSSLLPAVSTVTSAVDKNSTSETPPNNSTPNLPKDTDESEDELCPICFEPWSNMGDHRIASLRCGHLFGLQCIRKWLSEATKKHKGKCPQCNRDFLKADIRPIYFKSNKVLVRDTAENESIMKKLQRARMQKQEVEAEVKQAKLKCQQDNKRMVELQQELLLLKEKSLSRVSQETSSFQSISSSRSKKRLIYKEWKQVCREGTCRVMAYSSWLEMLVISLPSQLSMFSGFGIRRINMLDMEIDKYRKIHEGEIKDLAFHPNQHHLLLSVSVDCIVKVSNIMQCTNVFQHVTSSPLWCCCWNTANNNLFYVGTSCSHVYQYDSRRTSGFVATFELPRSGPVVSMTHHKLWRGLVVVCLLSCYFIETEREGEARIHLLSLEGVFTSLSCNSSSPHMLVSCRPSKKHPHVRHILLHLKKTVNCEPNGNLKETIDVELMHTFQGGISQKILTRSLLAYPSHHNDSLLVYAIDESTQSVCVWDAITKECLVRLQCSGLVLDLLEVKYNGTPHLAILTDKGVKLYSWV